MVDPALDPAVIDTLRQLSEPGGPDVLIEVFGIFLVETPKRLADIEAALAAGNLNLVHRAAHSLKGSAGNIGARPMFETCRLLDDEARSGKPEQIAKLVASVRYEYRRVESAIAHLLQSKP